MLSFHSPHPFVRHHYEYRLMHVYIYICTNILFKVKREQIGTNDLDRSRAWTIWKKIIYGVKYQRGIRFQVIRRSWLHHRVMFETAGYQDRIRKMGQAEITSVSILLDQQFIKICSIPFGSNILLDKNFTKYKNNIYVEI